MVNRVKTIEGPGDYRDTGIKKERKELIKEARDKARNIRRATEAIEGHCIVCGKEIKKGQPIRTLPKDKKCQEVRLYHLRGCGPGSENWKAFKANGKKTPRESFQWRQLTFNFTLRTH
jgi:hypothetical protein